MRKLVLYVKALGRSNRANVAIITALAALPLFGMMGLTIDYALALLTKTKLDSAADAAAVAAVTTAQNIIMANKGETGTALVDGAARGLEVFKANMGSAGFLTESPTPTIPPVIRSGQTLTETITYTATQRNNFGKMFNAPTTKISGSAVTSVTMAQYIDFYLLLDVSGSMGFPSTIGGAADLKKINNDDHDYYPNGCEFACHILPKQGFIIARANHIQLRADAVGNAVCQLIQTAKSKATMPDQYRVGVYPFIVDFEEFSVMSKDLDKVMSDVNGGSSGGCSTSTPASAIGNLLDTGETSSPMGSGGTHFEVVLPHMSTKIAKPGDGSSTGATKPIVFLVTDGMQNDQGFQYNSETGKRVGSNSQYWWSSSQPKLMDPSDCEKLKARGITVAVLNIPYQTIKDPNPAYSDNEDGKANDAITGTPNIASTLKKCASQNFYFTANTPQDITDAMKQMFAQATLQARITN